MSVNILKKCNVTLISRKWKLVYEQKHEYLLLIPFVNSKDSDKETVI